jgi:hypothetical protein
MRKRGDLPLTNGNANHIYAAVNSYQTMDENVGIVEVIGTCLFCLITEQQRPELLVYYWDGQICDQI